LCARKKRKRERERERERERKRFIENISVNGQREKKRESERGRELYRVAGGKINVEIVRNSAVLPPSIFCRM